MKTNLLVRPAARGGKYLGPDAADSSGASALVYMTDPATRRLVAFAFVGTQGGKDAGPATPVNLMAPISRAAPYATDANTVSAQLSVDIESPAQFEVTVYGPLSFPDQARMASAYITLLPGVDIGSTACPEGLVIEVPGLCISGVTADFKGRTVTCQATVTMMCGCKISNTAGSYWPPANFTVQLVTLMTSGASYAYDLSFAPANSTASTFAGSWPTQASPDDRVRQAWIYASEPSLGNQGMYPIWPDSTFTRPLELEEALERAKAAP